MITPVMVFGHSHLNAHFVVSSGADTGPLLRRAATTKVCYSNGLGLVGC